MKATTTWLTAMVLIASTSVLAPVTAYAKNDKKDHKEHSQNGKVEPPGQARRQQAPGQAGRRQVVPPSQQPQWQAEQRAKRDRLLQQQQRQAVLQQEQQRQAAQRQQAARQDQERRAAAQRAQELRQRDQIAQQQRVVTRSRQQRLSQQRQQQLINEQRQRTAQYAALLNRQAAAAQQRAAALQQQRRVNQYGFQQQYQQRLRQQQIAVDNDGTYNYGSDPYFYTPPAYEYQRGGTSYQVNQYAADQLNQAINLGYDQGLRAGRADRADRWRYDYRSSYAYQDANYGYEGRYVSQADYNYYFRRGMRKGYDDGYYGRYQYGKQANGGSTSIFSSVLQQILNLVPLR